MRYDSAVRWTLLVGALAAMLAASVIGGAGCFSPRVADCAQACGPNNSCASGLACEESTQLCRVPANMGTACPGVVDGAIDAVEVDAPIVVDVA